MTYGQRFRELQLREGNTLKGDFTLAHIEGPEGKVPCFAGIVESTPNTKQAEALRAGKLTPALELRFADVLRDPAGQYVYVPVSSVTLALPAVNGNDSIGSIVTDLAAQLSDEQDGDALAVLIDRARDATRGRA